MTVRRNPLGLTYCPVCAVETIPMRKGTCAWCDSPTQPLKAQRRHAARGRTRRAWSVADIVAAVRRWASEHGGVPPRASDWTYAGEYWPSFGSVYTTCGSWSNAIAEAGFTRPRPGRGYAAERLAG